MRVAKTSQPQIVPLYCVLFVFFVVQNFAGEKEDFLLFASLFEVTMIDPSIGTRLVTFELSIGETMLVTCAVGCFSERTSGWL